jgi:CheY-like chemotaxis protein
METNISSRRTILLVEDDPDDLFLLSRAFRNAQLDCELQRVRDGAEAIAYLAGSEPYANRHKHPLPQVMLLDLHLPRVSGLEVLEFVAKLPAEDGPYVILLSASASAPEPARAFALGANRHAEKTATYSAVIEALRFSPAFPAEGRVPTCEQTGG